MIDAPKRKGFRLNEAGDEAYSNWLGKYEGSGCTCFLSPPCGFCTHEGNPYSAEETEEFWESDVPEFNVMDSIRAACGSTKRRTIWDSICVKGDKK